MVGHVHIGLSEGLKVTNLKTITDFVEDEYVMDFPFSLRSAAIGCHNLEGNSHATYQRSHQNRGSTAPNEPFIGGRI